MMRLFVLAMTSAVAFASDAGSESFMARPSRLLGGGGTDPVTGDADMIDNMMEEKTAPHSVPGWVYTLLTPFLGAALFIFSFPVIWFNEQRANGALAKMYDEVPTSEDTSMKGKAESKEKAAEKEYLTKEKEMERKYFPCCRWKCCDMVEAMCKKMPKGDSCDVKANAIRCLGLLMMLVGTQMMFAPLFWALNFFWIIGFLIGGHLALCVIKMTCCAFCCTAVTGNVVHNPWMVMAIFLLTSLTFAGYIYYMMPKNSD